MYGSVFQVIGFVTAASGAMVAVAYFLSKLFATKWLETKFEERLKHLEHRHNQELEKLQYEIEKLPSMSDCGPDRRLSRKVGLSAVRG